MGKDDIEELVEMLITLVDVVGCENPDCREFARIISVGGGARSYYCPVCGEASRCRAIDAALAAMPQDYEAYLRRTVLSAKTDLTVPT